MISMGQLRPSQDDIIRSMNRVSPLMTRTVQQNVKRRAHSFDNLDDIAKFSLLTPLIRRNQSVDSSLMMMSSPAPHAEARKTSKFLPAMNRSISRRTLNGERLLNIILDNDCGKLQNLLKKGDVDHEQPVIKTLLHQVCFTGCLVCLKLLLKHGFQADCVNEERWTPLHAAIMADKADVVRFLLPLYANVNVTNVLGISPLHVAVYTNNLHLTHVLVRQYNADIFLDQRKIMTPFQLAIDLKHTLILDYFILNAVSNDDDNAFLSHDEVVK